MRAEGAMMGYCPHIDAEKTTADMSQARPAGSWKTIGSVQGCKGEYDLSTNQNKETTDDGNKIQGRAWQASDTKEERVKHKRMIFSSY